MLAGTKLFLAGDSDPLWVLGTTEAVANTLADAQANDAYLLGLEAYPVPDQAPTAIYVAPRAVTALLPLSESHVSAMFEHFADED